MKTHLLRWVSIALFLFVAVIGFLRKPIAAAPQFPCRPTPNLCQPDTQPPPCQPITCPNADRKESARGEQHEGE